MGTKYLTHPVIWRSFLDESFFSEVGLPREPFIDRRNGEVKLRVFDGITPGGRPIGGGFLNIVKTPTTVSPLDTATGISTTPILTSSVYQSANSDLHPHSATRWQIATDPLFTDKVFDSGSDTENLTSIDLQTVGNVVLDGDTTYYTRFNHESSSGHASEWSPITSFTTDNALPSGNEVFRLTASDKSDYHFFGNSVAISGDGYTTVVGAANIVRSPTENGAVYIFNGSGSDWTETAILTESTVPEGGMFGEVVAISADGSTIAVSAVKNPTNEIGAVFIYVRSGQTWVQQAKLLPSDGPEYADQYGRSFGLSIALSSDGDTLMVGAPFRTVMVGSVPNQNPVLQAGSVYVYTRAGTVWTEVAILSAGDAMVDGYYGMRVTMSSDGTVMAIGAVGIDSYAGAVYICTRDNGVWSQTAKIQPSNTAPGITFGNSVSLSSSGIVLLATAPFTELGAAYIFARGADGIWTQRTTLTDPYGGFAVSAALSGDGTKAVVCSGGKGFLYVNDDGVWTEVNTLQDSNGFVEVNGEPTSSEFGYSVDISGNGNVVIIGDRNDNGDVEDRWVHYGAAYIF